MKNLTKERIRELELCEKKLLALENGGVDNWEFYDEALTEYNKEVEKEDKLLDLLQQIEATLFAHAYEPSEHGAGYCATEEDRDDALYILRKGISELTTK